MLAVGAIVYFSVVVNQSGVLRLEGKITNIRLQPLRDGATIAIADFELKNPSGSDFEVRSAELAVVQEAGITPATLLSKQRSADYLHYEKIALPNPLFGAGDVVKAGANAGGMMMGRFDASPATMAGKTIRVKLTSVNGIVVQLIGTREMTGRKQ
jgi:hypothetical protein